MFNFDPSISHVDSALLGIDIPSRTTAFGEKVAKVIEERKKTLGESRCIILDLEKLGEAERTGGYDIVRANIIAGLEQAFRGRIQLNTAKKDNEWEYNKWFNISEGDGKTGRFVRLEFKVV